MSRRKQKGAARPAWSPWYRVHTFARCAYGHDIASGELAHYNRTSKASICAPCMKQHYDIEPPPRPVVFAGDAPIDVRARQSGE